MDIGRKLLSESEFANLWSILYQELYSLATTHSCDASLVYNTIYIICTANSSLEEKLYWKIGDFLYNRCKCHKDGILGVKDYLREYITQFREYDILVTNLNKLGCFLNENVKGKKLSDFGYLLWERVVIQNLKKNFFEEVFDYLDDDRIAIIKSFEKIIPDQNNPLLFYNGKYENIAIEKIRNSYKIVEIDNLLDFSDYIYRITIKATTNMKTRFLESSYAKVMDALEDSLFGLKYYELILNIADILKFYNGSNLNQVLSACVMNDNENNKIEIDQENLCYLKNDFMSISNRNQATNNRNNEKYDSSQIRYESLSSDKIERLKIFIEEEFVNNKALNKVVNLVFKKLEAEIALRNENIFSTILSQFSILHSGFVILKKAYALYIDSIIKSNHTILSYSVNNIFLLVNSLDLFECDHFHEILVCVLKYYLQRTKPCFMNRLCKFTNLIVGHTFKKVIETANLKNEKFADIADIIQNHNRIINEEQSSGKNTLQKSTLQNKSTEDFYSIQFRKQNFDQNSDEFKNTVNFNNFAELKPFEMTNNSEIERYLNNSNIFKVLIELVSDKREFLNMYQNILKERLLNRTSDLNLELYLLSIMDIPKDDKLYKMIYEANSCLGNFKLLNSLYWNIEPENSMLRIPNELIKEIVKEFPSIKIFESNGNEICNTPKINEIGKKINLKSKFTGSTNIEDQIELKKSKKQDKTEKNNEIRFKMILNEGTNKIIKLAHQCSKIILQIDKTNVKMNIYQYCIINYIKNIKEPNQSSLDQITSQLSLQESLAKNILGSLVMNGLLYFSDDNYYLDCGYKTNNFVNIQPVNSSTNLIDISEIAINDQDNYDICVDSYLQSLCVSILKRQSSCTIVNLLSEIRALARIDIEPEIVNNSIQKIVEKGLGEIKGDLIEYSQ